MDSSTFHNTIFDGSQVNFAIAFTAGFITFFASCLLPLVPTYLAYLSGVAINDEHHNQQEKWRIFKVALFFVFGFVATFVLLSLAFNVVSGVLVSFRETVKIIGGFIFIILGLFMLGVFKHRIFSTEKRLDLNKIFLGKGLLGRSVRSLIGKFMGKEITAYDGGVSLNEFFSKYKKLHAVLTGVVFGFGWTPCIGPVLAVILYWSAHSGSVLYGTLLLIAYGVGLGVPFLIVALGFEKIIPLLKRYARISQYVSYVSGAVIILAGVLMISGKFQELWLTVIEVVGMKGLGV